MWKNSPSGLACHKSVHGVRRPDPVPALYQERFCFSAQIGILRVRPRQCMSPKWRWFCGCGGVRLLDLPPAVGVHCSRSAKSL